MISLDEIAHDNKFNILNILEMDHKYLNECIKVLKGNSEKKDKIRYAKTFLDALKKHSEAEKKVVYSCLIKIEDMKKEIMEGEVEHNIADHKIRQLIPKLTGMRILSDELEVEIKVLAEIVEHHIKEEEAGLFPKMKRDLDRIILNEMGFQFMKLRSFTTKDLRQYPKLQKEVSNLKKLGHRLSANFGLKVLKHSTSVTHPR